MNVWKEWDVELRFTNWLMGGTPKNPELIADWLEVRGVKTPKNNPFLGELQPRDMEAEAEEIKAGIEATEERSWCGFQSQNGQGPCLRGYHVKAHMKDCANILKGILDVKALRSKVADRCYVVDDYIPLGVKEPSGYFEHPVHVMTAQGPRSALKRSDYVDSPTIKFRLRVLADKVVDKALLEHIFEYGGTHGMGSDRGMGFGRYELVGLTEMS